jgi:hypothetical protein
MFGPKKNHDEEDHTMPYGYQQLCKAFIDHINNVDNSKWMNDLAWPNLVNSQASPNASSSSMDPPRAEPAGKG